MYQSNTQQRKFNKDPNSMMMIPNQPKIQINHHFILEVMRQNDTLVVKRGVCPSNYFAILLQHQKQTNCKVVRLEALGSAISNLIKVT